MSVTTNNPLPKDLNYKKIPKIANDQKEEPADIQDVEDC